MRRWRIVMPVKPPTVRHKPGATHHLTKERDTMPPLNPGDHFPPITITPVAAEPIDLPDALARHFAVILFNRGAWCPYCNAQLRAFQRHAEELDALDVKVVSLSVDDEDTARGLIAKHGLTFPVGHSADAAAIHEATGAFVNTDPVHLQSTGFVLDPDGNVIISVYSSGPIGRLVPEDVVGLVKYVKSKQPA
jgi:peroxiredoxin